jgi:hypothetical protein
MGTEAFDRSEDVVGVFGPTKWFRIGIVVLKRGGALRAEIERSVRPD